MKRLFLLSLFAVFLHGVGQAQCLFGFRTVNGHSGSGHYWDMVRMNLNTDSFTTLQANCWRGQNWNLINAHYTADKTNGRFFSKLVSAAGSSIPDTLLEINISSGATIRRPIPKNTLLFPAFYNNKIYGLSPTGIGVFDLVTQTYTQLSTAAKADRPGFTYKNNSSLDAVNGRYFFLFDKQATGVCDTLGIYNIGANTVVLDTFAPANLYPQWCWNFEYLPGTNKIYFNRLYMGGFGAGYYSYDFVEKTIVLEKAYAHAGGLHGPSALDSAGKIYYRHASTFTAQVDTLVKYDITTKNLTLLPTTGYLFYQFDFFPASALTVAAGGLSIAETSKPSPVILYPNPARDVLHFSNDIATKYPLAVQIIDVSGKLLSVHSLEAGNNQIDVRSLAPGVYYVSFPTSPIKSTSFVKE